MCYTRYRVLILVPRVNVVYFSSLSQVVICPFALAVMKDGTVVGHIPKKISSVCSLYLRRGGSIICRVMGSRRYSEYLIQGGLEIPCVLIFEGGAQNARVKNFHEYKFQLFKFFAVFIFAFRSWVAKIKNLDLAKISRYTVDSW